MPGPMLDVVFGSQAATRVLLFMQNYGQAYAREIARTYESTSLSQVQKQLAKFEQGGLLVSRLVGTVRLYEWNRRNPVVSPLREFLQATIELLPAEEIEKYFMQRRRPRRAGKALEFQRDR
jgi:DNA-binding transcriptional ArsR family regulator